MSGDEPKYRLVLVAQRSDVDVLVRLRQLLKVMLRRFNFRCVRIERVNREEGRDVSSR